MSCDRVRYDGHEGLGPEVALIRCSISVITGMEDSSNTSQCPVTELDIMGMQHLDQRYCCYCNVCCDQMCIQRTRGQPGDVKGNSGDLV